MKYAVARVAVASATYAIDRPYDYSIPESMGDKVLPGMRVKVPFGKGNRQCEGIVLSVSSESVYEKLKFVADLLDEEPVLREEDLHLALWMRDRFFCTVYDAVHAILPSGFWYTGDKRNVRDKTVRYAALNVPAEEAAELAEKRRRRAPQQAAVLQLLSAIGSASIKEILYFTGTTAATVSALERQGLVQCQQVEVFRRPKYAPAQDAPTFFQLNPEQEEAFRGIAALQEKNQAAAALLFGVTGSGKTAIYVQLIRNALAAGKSAVLLVPEIGLTPQFVSLFSACFGEQVAVLHSSLSVGERYDEWKRIRNGQARVVIGTRSAVFAPIEHLGLLIIDEEQESTYKSENTPRYHAREIAKYRCVHAGALLLLGSATPSVESMYCARQGQYALFTLKNRYNRMDLPTVRIVDMKRELKEGNGTVLSSVLRQELQQNLDRGEQSILFINRRGTANLVVCGACGYTFQCRNCSVSMTYHKANQRLMCHYCGYSLPIPAQCPECGAQLKFIGAGTQKVEEEIRNCFPGVETLRMDTDTVSPANSHEKILRTFRERKIPILIGTQMVTKGLDFEGVTLVGVISADQMLYVNDYRAHERTFSLITQVIGRSGRGEKSGRAVVQTFTPDHEVIALAAAQDYPAFYRREIAVRELAGAPPILDLIVLTVSGMNEAAVLRGCALIRDSLAGYLAPFPDTKILGPAPAAVTKVNNRYRYRISLSCRNNRKVRDIVAHVMRTFAMDGQNRGISVFADVDPMD